MKLAFVVAFSAVGAGCVASTADPLSQGEQALVPVDESSGAPLASDPGASKPPKPPRDGVLPAACRDASCPGQVKPTPGFDMGCFGACGAGCARCKKLGTTTRLEKGCKITRTEYDCPVADCCAEHDECCADAYCRDMPNNPVLYDIELNACHAQAVAHGCAFGAFGVVGLPTTRRKFVEESSNCVQACTAVEVAE
ncbi:MAG: hypothetical protein IPJ34_34270 [Myxococcales bacterium]|nr:hypothetical protein [Myxococcales bacterium]